ncbi:MAG: hypothetical protein CO108_25395 [Deltaproteobacteria bacterium CG_4_9_14_3_um_filter_63_12]|nr:MAG: hypothetical protein CO108_25395 [Deltaproteobacteria bacterium CG_4_9_14_3_um_filter_63_12]
MKMNLNTPLKLSLLLLLLGCESIPAELPAEALEQPLALTCPAGSQLAGTAGESQWCEASLDGVAVKQGPAVLWHPNGAIQMRTQYVNGTLNGLKTTWYPNGQKSGEANLLDGVEHGLAEGWHTNGQLRSRGWVNQGKPCGTLQWWDDQGKPVSCRKDLELVFGCKLTPTGAECPSCE